CRCRRQDLRIVRSRRSARSASAADHAQARDRRNHGALRPGRRHAARLQAVIGGRAHATLVNTVTALKGVMDGKVTVVARLSAEFPGLGYVWNVVRTEALAKPELAAAFQTMTDIGIRGSRFIMANPDEAAAILHERLGELDLAFLTAVVRDLN